MLSESERNRYNTLKESIQAGKHKLAKTLYEIRSRRLYREEFASFDAFCRSYLDYTKRTCDRYAAWGHALHVLGPDGPTCEAQARPLAPLLGEGKAASVQEIWAEVRERWKRPTQAQVQAAVKEYVEEHTPAGPPPSNPPPGAPGDDSDEDSPDKNSPDKDSADEKNSNPPPGPPPAPEAGAYLVADSELLAAEELASRPAPAGEALAEAAELPAEVIQQVAAVAGVSGSLVNGSPEAAVADTIWPVITPSLTSAHANLPTGSGAPCVFLHAGRLGQIASQSATASAYAHSGRVLIAPGVDLFAPVVPDGFIESVLHAIRGSDLVPSRVTPILYTRWLSRAASFDLPAPIWVGTPADRTTLQDVDEALQKVTGVAVRWVLYDVQKVDKDEGPPTVPASIDWIVYDPPGGGGVQLTLEQANALVSAGVKAGATSCFRRHFKTHSLDHPELGSA